MPLETKYQEANYADHPNSPGERFRLLFRALIAIAVPLLILFPINFVVEFWGTLADTPSLSAIIQTYQSYFLGVFVGVPALLLLRHFKVRDALPLIALVALSVVLVSTSKGAMCVLSQSDAAPFRLYLDASAPAQSQCIFYALLNFIVALPKGLAVMLCLIGFDSRFTNVMFPKVAKRVSA